MAMSLVLSSPVPSHPWSEDSRAALKTCPMMSASNCVAACETWSGFPVPGFATADFATAVCAIADCAAADCARAGFAIAVGTIAGFAIAVGVIAGLAIAGFAAAAAWLSAW